MQSAAGQAETDLLSVFQRALRANTDTDTSAEPHITCFLCNGMFPCVFHFDPQLYNKPSAVQILQFILNPPNGIRYLQRICPCCLYSKHTTIITVFFSCEACPNYLVWPKLSSTPLIPVAGSLGLHCTMSSTVNTARRTNTWTCRCKCEYSSTACTQRVLPCNNIQKNGISGFQIRFLHHAVVFFGFVRLRSVNSTCLGVFNPCIHFSENS